MNQMLFSQLGLTSEINRAIEKMGFVSATEIQSKAIPMIRQGMDIIGKSHTGTGKTVAFGIPAVEMVGIKNVVEVLILCPTRELAVQACGELKKISKFKNGVKVVDIYGGAPMEGQIKKLKTANIVIGTPGRIMDHIKRRTLKLDKVKMVILDEADEMLSMGFREDIECIMDYVPKDRQTVLFSATIPTEILAFTRKFQDNPQMVAVNSKQATVDNISQYYYNVPMGRKMDALNALLRYFNPKLSIIFCNTKKMVDYVTEYLHINGFKVEGLHGDMKQSQRIKVMNSFKLGLVNILIATDVAARGIDVSGVDYVFNYDIPQNTEYYVHRIGRTGRAGKKGEAVTICSGHKQVDVLLKIGKLTKSNIVYRDMPTIDNIKKSRFSSYVKEIEYLINNGDKSSYSSVIDELVKKGYTCESILNAMMKLCFGNVNDFNINNVESLPMFYTKKNINKYQKININIGRVNKISPNHIVGAIIKSTNLIGKEIGKIEIYDRHTIVDIPENKVNKCVKDMKHCKIHGIHTITKVHRVNV